MSELLRCSMCERHLHRDEFNKDKNKRGRKYWCRSCQSEYRKEYYRKNKETENKWFKSYYWKNLEYHKSRYKEWYDENHKKECGPDCTCRRAVEARAKSPTKTCPRCETEKPKSQFYKDERRPDGLYSWCKEC